MLRSIDLSRAGMLRQGQVIDAVAHNIANANTPGFKAIRAALESGDVAAAQDPENATGTDTPPLTARMQTGRVFTQGALHQTGAVGDMAITGEGFFIVRRQDGSAAYTRGGAFRPDAQGRLVDGSGNLLQPGITVPANTSELRIAPDGTVNAVVEGGRTRVAGQLRLARFTNPDGLEAAGDGLYIATDAAGLPQALVPGQNGIGNVTTGALEDANTDITEQMSSLVAAQRAYQLNTSAFRMADEMLKLSTALGGNG
jgi:flagellar basal-body rod protein FlgG